MDDYLVQSVLVLTVLVKTVKIRRKGTLTQFTMDDLPCAVSIGVDGVGEESQCLKGWHSHTVQQVRLVVGLQQ